MYKYPITINLLSETIFGNGQSKNGIVNTDVLVDEEGFPYYLGKSFKGCLKKSMNTILRPFYCSKKVGFNEIFNNFFGVPKKGDDNLQTEGILKFTNFYIDGQIANVFKEDMIEKQPNKDLILASLTDIRFGIKMGDTGVAESKSLRASRVLKKGLAFNGSILCPRELDKTELGILENGIKSLKNLGVSKSRGKGLVQIKIGDVIKKESESVDTIDGDFNYLFYEIDLKQPIKIGDSQSQYDYEQTKSYVSGSIVRGSVIGKYLRLKNSRAENVQNDFNELLKKACFYDAYPIYEGHYSFPSPNIFRTTKDIDKEDKTEYKRDTDFSIVFDDKKIEEEPTVIKLKKGEFSYYENNTIYQFNVKKDYRFHHSQELKKENIFRYESIAKGQKFYGVVDISDINNKDLKKDIYNLLKEGETFFLGGSRTSGYGETKVSKIEKIKNFETLKEKISYFKEKSIENKVNIYSLSDSILRDEYHQIRACFSEEYLKEKLGIDISKENINSEISPVILTGYNSTWKSYLPHVYGIEKGSVIEIDLNNQTKPLDEACLNEFMKNQKGDRKQDGLGRFLINPEFLNAENIIYKGINKIDNYKYNGPVLGPFDEKKLAYIKESKYKAIVDKCIKTNTIKSLEGKAENDITNTQINNIIGMIDAILLSKDVCMSKFKENLNQLEQITQNSERNKRNQKILNYNILLGNDFKKLESLVKLSVEEKKQCVKNILETGIEQNKFSKKILEKLTEKGSKDEASVDDLILKVIRDVMYYSLKSKVGENIE